MSRPTDTPQPSQPSRLLDDEQEQLAEELMMSISLAVESGRLSLTRAEGALALTHMRLDAMIGDLMEAQVDAEQAAREEEEDPNAFLRRQADDTES